MWGLWASRSTFGQWPRLRFLRLSNDKDCLVIMQEPGYGFSSVDQTDAYTCMGKLCTDASCVARQETMRPSSAECPDACEKANFSKAEPNPRSEMRLLEVKASGFTEARCTDLHHIRLDQRVGHLHNSCGGPQDCFQ